MLAVVVVVVGADCSVSSLLQPVRARLAAVQAMMEILVTVFMCCCFRVVG